MHFRPAGATNIAYARLPNLNINTNSAPCFFRLFLSLVELRFFPTSATEIRMHNAAAGGCGCSNAPIMRTTLWARRLELVAMAEH
jgi:hypothetical protein